MSAPSGFIFLFRILVFFIFQHLFILFYAQAANPFTETEVDELIKRSLNYEDRGERIAFISGHFLGLPYITSPLGEGQSDAYDSDPLYRFDAFDCTTFVETMATMARSFDVEDFKIKMNEIRYHDGEVSFITRNHFTSLDWIPHNEENGLLTDITTSIGPYEIATALINKLAWYEKFHHPEFFHFVERFGEQPAQEALIPYIPLNEFFSSQGQANPEILNAIIQGSVINLITPGRDLGVTQLNVRHQGLAIWKKGKLYFREASSGQKKTVDSLFIQYFKQYINSSTVKGFNVVRVN